MTRARGGSGKNDSLSYSHPGAGSSTSPGIVESSMISTRASV
jgi:hypothetical protein